MVDPESPVPIGFFKMLVSKINIFGGLKPTCLQPTLVHLILHRIFVHLTQSIHKVFSSRNEAKPGEGYVSLLGSILLRISGHFVKPCETAPMGQGSLLAVLAYGELTFRLRYAYGILRQGFVFFSDFINPDNYTMRYNK